MVGTDVATSPGGRSGGTEETTKLPGGTEPVGPESRTRRFALHPVPIAVLAVGLGVTATLAFTARALHDSNENRLLRQRINEAAAVISSATLTTQSPLSSGAVLAEATDGNRSEFTQFMKPLSAGAPFISVSLWAAQGTNIRPLIVVGAAPELAARPASEIRRTLSQATAKSAISIVDLLGSSDRRLGYAFSVGPKAHYVVYAESARPQNRRSNVDSNTAFADLDYAIYLGNAPNPQSLLAASVVNPKFTGRVANDVVPFGDSQLDLVMSPRRELGGGLLARLPWLIGGFGIVLTAAAALVAERLVRRRAVAERLAQQNARLFSEQRSVAQTLQHSLLPELSELPGLELAVRYVAGVDGVEIGGDWYDVIDLGNGHAIVVVGDVSGRGLRAATVMASLRYSIRAYAAEGYGPSEILFKLSKLISVDQDGHFATVLCGLVDVAEHRVVIANAGHPNPLLITGSTAEFIRTEVGPPIGVANTTPATVTVTVPGEATLVAFTDGIFERRGESPDVGLERLRAAAVGFDSIDDLLDGLLHSLTPDGATDDTAILAVRWRP